MRVAAAASLFWILTAAAWAQPAGEPDACVACHTNPDWVGEEAAQLAELHARDVHTEAGLSCHGCHGGNPDPSLSEDPEASMDESFRPTPFLGAPDPPQVARFCGSCHSDAERMRRFRPALRVDQEQEYWTSQHGRALRAGDLQVATCVSCHGAHGILRSGDPRSPVYPTRVAETCNVCHGDPQLMDGRVDERGRPLDTTPYPLWRQSVHARSMFEREDLSAPTCNDCHGNHGAAPPGVDSITFVCGQCHGREAGLFRRSTKAAAWRQHDEYLAEAGAESCLACHDADTPQAALTHMRSFGECTVCHGNHGVLRPTVAMFSPLPPTPCAFCHEGTDGEDPGLPERYPEIRDELLAAGREGGYEDARLFDWMVDRARELSFHRRDGTEGAEGLRPEFAELFDKFRIGKTVEGEVRVVRCTDCHSGDSADTGSAGLLTGIHFLEKMQALTSLTARAERVLLAARRGGVETREGFVKVDQAVDSQISLEALVHGFTDGGAFAETHAEGMESAREALEAGAAARGELSRRRQGLVVALVVILAFLAALGAKIRFGRSAG